LNWIRVNSTQFNANQTHASRKYSVSDKMAYLFCEVVDDTVKTIIEKEGLGNAFDPELYIYGIFCVALAASAFGKRYVLFKISRFFKSI